MTSPPRSSAVAPPVVTQASAPDYGISRRKFVELVKLWGLPHSRHKRLYIVRTEVLLAALEKRESTPPANDVEPLTGDAAVDAVLERVGLRRGTAR